uniref:Uncharacterized protein n=1 Tax=Oryza sativa subsp. japonica TaxID=39947 RepID=Q7XIT6_ORYSJ|nr:hypothetical protein [Oryza sativa Japonica Group]BAD31020.1 hypothetical protein [Oryza sativa Japonica Group]
MVEVAASGPGTGTCENSNTNVDNNTNNASSSTGAFSKTSRFSNSSLTHDEVEPYDMENIA